MATFANWVAKTANLLQGDLAAEPGDRLALLLPAHWQTRRLAARLLLGRCRRRRRRRPGRRRPRRRRARPAGARRAPAPASGSRWRCARSAAASRSRRRASPTTRSRCRARATGSRRSRRWTRRRPRCRRAGPSCTGAEVVEQARGRRRGPRPDGPRLPAAVGLPYDTWQRPVARACTRRSPPAAPWCCAATWTGWTQEPLAKRIESERVTATAPLRHRGGRRRPRGPVARSAVTGPRSPAAAGTMVAASAPARASSSMRGGRDVTESAADPDRGTPATPTRRGRPAGPGRGPSPTRGRARPAGAGGWLRYTAIGVGVRGARPRAAAGWAVYEKLERQHHRPTPTRPPSSPATRRSGPPRWCAARRTSC